MPPKVRVLIKALKSAGFELRRTRGSHRCFAHPEGPLIVLGGKDGADALPYQILQVKDAIARVQDEEK